MVNRVRCPYCRFEIEPLEAAVICSECGRILHRDCWRANLRCVTKGCEGEPILWSPARGGYDASHGIPEQHVGRHRRLQSALAIAISILSLGMVLYVVAFVRTAPDSVDGNPRVCDARLAVHLTPRPTSPVIAEVPRGSRIELLAVTTKSAKIRTPEGCVGFVPRDKLSLPGAVVSAR